MGDDEGFDENKILQVNVIPDDDNLADDGEAGRENRINYNTQSTERWSIPILIAIKVRYSV